MSYTANVQIEIDASIEKVWEAITDPELVKQYFFGTTVQSTWEVGEPITFSGEWEGKSYQDKGVITSCEPPHTLAFTYWSSHSELPDAPENYNNIAYELKEDEGKTAVKITQDGSSSEEARDHSEANWKMVLEGMKKLLEEV